MNRRFLNQLLSFLAVMVTVAGCSGRPARVHPPAIDADAAGIAAIAAHDKNRDGRVSGDEFDTTPALKVAPQRTGDAVASFPSRLTHQAIIFLINLPSSVGPISR